MSGWTVDTLKALMDERDVRYTERWQAQEKALVEARRNEDHWRENANNWRTAMTEKDRNFVTKHTIWGYFVGLVGLVFALSALFIK